MSQELDIDIVEAESNNAAPVYNCADYIQRDAEPTISSKKPSKMNPKGKSNQTNSSMYHWRSQISSTDFNSTSGMTYPNLPLKAKLNSKTKKRQFSQAHNPMSSGHQSRRDIPLNSQFQKSNDNRYFDSND